MTSILIASLVSPLQLAAGTVLPGLELELARLRSFHTGALTAAASMGAQIRISDEGHRLWWGPTMIDPKTGAFTVVYATEMPPAVLAKESVPISVSWQRIPPSWPEAHGSINFFGCEVITPLADRDDLIAFWTKTNYRYTAGVEGATIKDTISLVSRRLGHPRANQMVFQIESGSDEHLDTSVPDLAEMTFLTLVWSRPQGATRWGLVSADSRKKLRPPEALATSRPRVLDVKAKRVFGFRDFAATGAAPRKPFVWHYGSGRLQTLEIPKEVNRPFWLDNLALIGSNRLLCSFIRIREGGGLPQVAAARLYTVDLRSGDWKKVGDYMLQATSASNRVLLLGQPWKDDRRWIVWL